MYQCMYKCIYLFTKALQKEFYNRHIEWMISLKRSRYVCNLFRHIFFAFDLFVFVFRDILRRFWFWRWGEHHGGVRHKLHANIAGPPLVKYVKGKDAGFRKTEIGPVHACEERRKQVRIEHYRPLHRKSNKVTRIIWEITHPSDAQRHCVPWPWAATQTGFCQCSPCEPCQLCWIDDGFRPAEAASTIRFQYQNMF